MSSHARCGSSACACCTRDTQLSSPSRPSSSGRQRFMRALVEKRIERIADEPPLLASAAVAAAEVAVAGAAAAGVVAALLL